MNNGTYIPLQKIILQRKAMNIKMCLDQVHTLYKNILFIIILFGLV